MVLSACDYYIVNPHHHQVGHIEHGGWGEDFSPCFEEHLFPHNYSRQFRSFYYTPESAGHVMGKDSLRNYYLQRYDDLGYINESGYVTIRFIISCMGEAGAHEVHELSMDFDEKKFSPALTDQLLTLTKEITQWRPITFGDSRFDSFFHLTFKLKNGQLVEILP